MEEKQKLCDQLIKLDIEFLKLEKAIYSIRERLKDMGEPVHGFGHQFEDNGEINYTRYLRAEDAQKDTERVYLKTGRKCKAIVVTGNE